MAKDAMTIPDANLARIETRRNKPSPSCSLFHPGVQSDPSPESLVIDVATADDHHDIVLPLSSVRSPSRSATAIAPDGSVRRPCF